MKTFLIIRLNFLYVTLLVFAPIMEIRADEPQLVLQNKSYEYGFSAGILFPGKINISDSYSDFSKPSSVLIKGFIDSYIMPDFSTGLFLQYSYSKIKEEKYNHKILEHNTSILEIGASIKRRFIFNPKWAIKPGINIGYRMFFFDFTADCDLEVDNAQGLGLNASCEIQYLYSPNNILFSEFGFISQPYGGKEDVTYLEFGLIFYVAVGVAF